MRIKTWQQRCEEHPDHDGIVSEAMIQARMQEEIDELRAAIEQAQPEQELVCVCGAIWEGQELVSAPSQRQWQGLTAEEIKASIQKAMQHFGFDPTQYSLAGAATVGFYGLVKEIEAKLREKNRD